MLHYKILVSIINEKSKVVIQKQQIKNIRNNMG